MTTKAAVNAIRRCLPELTELDALTLVERGILAKCAAGEIILENGIRPDGLLVVIEGSSEAEVEHLGGFVCIRRMDGAQVLGEISWLDGAVTSARVVARSSMSVLRISTVVLENALTQDSARAVRFYRSLAVMLAGRLRTVPPPAVAATFHG